MKSGASNFRGHIFLGGGESLSLNDVYSSIIDYARQSFILLSCDFLSYHLWLWAVGSCEKNCLPPDGNGDIRSGRWQKALVKV